MTPVKETCLFLCISLHIKRNSLQFIGCNSENARYTWWQKILFMAGHFPVCAFTLGSKRLHQVFNVSSLSRYRLYLSMCNLYLIRERNCTSCTYSGAPSEQLHNIFIIPLRIVELILWNKKVLFCNFIRMEGFCLRERRSWRCKGTVTEDYQDILVHDYEKNFL